MGKIKYKKVDAFTNGNSLGNPAACLILGENKGNECRHSLWWQCNIKD